MVHSLRRPGPLRIASLVALAVCALATWPLRAAAQDASPPGGLHPVEEDAYYRPRPPAEEPATSPVAPEPSIADAANGGLFLRGKGWFPLAVSSDVHEARSFIGPALELHIFLGKPEPGLRLFLGATIGVSQVFVDEEDASGTSIYEHRSFFIRSGGFAGVELWGDSPVDPYVAAVAGMRIESRDTRALVTTPGIQDSTDQLVGGFLELRVGCMYRTGIFYLDAHLDLAWFPGNEFFALGLGINVGIGIVI